MDEFEKIRAFSAELGKKTEEAVAAENEEPGLQPAEKEQTSETPADTERADFLENWSAPTENAEEVRRLSKTFWLVLAGVTLLLGCLIVVIYLLLKGPIENDEVVTITPTQKPVKVRPENPGGMVVPDQDKVIYSRLTQDTIPAKVEKLFPEEEKPVMPEVVTESVESAEADEIPVFEEIEEVKVVQAEKPVEIKEETKKVEPKKQPVKEVKPAPKGEWKVQLFSSADKTKVEKQWQVISQKQKALVSDMPMQIVPVKLEGKGTYYRLYVGAFETREMANNLCTKLKKQKQDCIPAK